MASETAAETTSGTLRIQDLSLVATTNDSGALVDCMGPSELRSASLAHEINNPLSVIVGNLDFALQAALTLASSDAWSPAVLSDLTESLRCAREGAARISAIVSDLRDSPQKGKQTKLVQVEALLESTLRLAKNEIAARARVFKDFQACPAIAANESRVGEMFLNLILNATQAIPAGHPEAHAIRIRTRLDATGPSDWVVIEIEDTGAGIAPEVLPRIFEPFFTTKSSRNGTGLGLAICRRLVASMQGTIEVESKLEQGTTFRLRLPVAKSAVRQPPAPCRPAPASRSATRPKSQAPNPLRARILVVDDEEQIGRVVRRMLSSEYDVEACTSATQALAALTAGRRFDVILCDLKMPEVTGVDFFHRVRSEWPNQAEKIVFLSGGACTDSSRMLLETVANDCVEKPIDWRALRRVLLEKAAHPPEAESRAETSRAG